MNIYLLAQDDNIDYDTWDSMVIVAENETDAKYLSFVEAYIIKEKCPSVSPETSLVWRNYYLPYRSYDSFGDWSEHPTITLLASNVNLPEGVICASFNAG